MALYKKIFFLRFIIAAKLEPLNHLTFLIKPFKFILISTQNYYTLK